MDVMRDLEGAVLVPFHVVPYTVKRDEYGDYPYTEKLDEGEVVAADPESLADKVESLALGIIASWGRSDCLNKGNDYHVTEYDLPALDRLIATNAREDRTWRGIASRPPRVHFRYVSFEDARIEMRREDGSLPVLGLAPGRAERVAASLRQAQVDAAASLRAGAEAAKALRAERTRAAKLAQLAALQAELGVA